MSEENNNSKNIDEHIDQQRWLLERGFINDLHKDNLFMYGSIVHKDVQAVQVDIDIENKRVVYEIYMTSELLKKIDRYQQLSQSTSIVGLWRFKRMIQKEGNLNLQHLLKSFVQDYCGPKWSVSLNLKDIKDYEEGFKDRESRDGVDNQQPDGR